MSKLSTPQCASAVKLAGENKQCVYRDGHDGMHRAYTLWSDSGYIEWASGNALSFDVAKTSPRLHLRLIESDYDEQSANAPSADATEKP